ncbi:MAG TPA: cysteine--tRNA ligase [Chloroflexia bacterium]|nr:cysteine--tRNA ligase [Chloroflexia bacterium]
MRLYDTLSQETQTLEFPDQTVKMYVCGVTPYDTSHLGHARVAVVYDTLRRFLQWTGLQVRYVQNVTDIDEPLFERAQRDGVSWRELGDRQTAYYLASLARLNVARPEFYIKATDEIDEMIPRIARLLELGHAYTRDGAVYYRVASKPDFGAIAHQDYATMLATANEMGNHPDDPHKEDPLDFVLWQRSQPGEPAWPSPWGAGRPGWHIECSTMATHYCGPQLDIHGGGADLIFPHHACEIAQAEPVTGVVPFVRAWMHVGLVSLGGIKMSKSLGNMVFVDQILQTHSANALRLAILGQPYRAPYEYHAADVDTAEAQIARLTAALARPSPHGAPARTAGVRERFTATLQDDFDTPAAIGVLLELAGAIVQGAADGQNPRPAQALLRELAGVLGLTMEETPPIRSPKGA